MELINPKSGTSEKKTLGELSIDVVVAPHARDSSAGFIDWFKYVLSSMFSLLKGMKITLGYLLRPSTVVTQQYPENRDTLKMFERFRGQLQLTYDEEVGYMRCNGCNFCELACPNGSIILKDRRNPVNEKKELDRFIWRLDCCTFCNACVQACPHDALEWSGDFEAAVYDRRLLVYTLNNYAGPPSMAVKRAIRKEERVEELKATVEPRQRYEGKLPMTGVPLPGVPALDIKKENSG
ncbi:MAG: 4Fe-4S binding protein [candidate division Zixibacteria bacterium]